MYLTDAEKVMCNELGILTDKEIKTAENLDYAGFGMYISQSCDVFEKLGEELVEVLTPEIEAEKRFLKHCKK